MPTKQSAPARPTRERILRAAKKLFQQRGYFAIGTAEILDVADAPKGSMYHHFPDGKEQIAIAAVHDMHEDILAMIDALHAKEYSVAEIVQHLALGMARWLKTSNWREGTMLASTAVGSVPDLPHLHQAIKQAFGAWQSRLTELLVAEGWKKTEARTMAQMIIATTEGAMILARIDQDERIVTKVAKNLALAIECNR